MSPKFVDKAQRKIDITRASITLFETQSIASTTIAMIAKEAGLSKGSFYELYANKSELILSIIAEMFLHMDDEIAPLLESEVNNRNKIEGFFMGVIQSTLDASVMQDIFFEVWRLAYIEKELPAIAMMQKFVELYLGLLRQLIEEGIKMKEFKTHDAMQSARAIGAMIDGLQLQAVVEKYDVLLTAKHAIARFLDGISLKGN